MGGGVLLEGFLLSVDTRYSGAELKAVSKDGKFTHTRNVKPVTHARLKIAIECILQDINSNTNLPESAYRNGIRLDTEYRCQNQNCNPSGKRRKLFVSAGPIKQPIQTKCRCGLLNTFWKNRIDFDEQGALQMKKL